MDTHTREKTTFCFCTTEHELGTTHYDSSAECKMPGGLASKSYVRIGEITWDDVIRGGTESESMSTSKTWGIPPYSL